MQSEQLAKLLLTAGLFIKPLGRNEFIERSQQAYKSSTGNKLPTKLENYCNRLHEKFSELESNEARRIFIRALLKEEQVVLS